MKNGKARRGLVIFEPIIKKENRGIIYTEDVMNANTTMLGTVKYIASDISHILVDDIIIFNRFCSKDIEIDGEKLRYVSKEWVYGVAR